MTQESSDKEKRMETIKKQFIYTHKYSPREKYFDVL